MGRLLTVALLVIATAGITACANYQPKTAVGARLIQYVRIYKASPVLQFAVDTAINKHCPEGSDSLLCNRDEVKADLKAQYEAFKAGQSEGDLSVLENATDEALNVYVDQGLQ